MKIIELQNITKIYNLYQKPIDRLKEVFSFSNKSYHTPFYALKNITFSIAKGSTVGIIGRNGSGKSTLLKIITGVLTPTSGSLKVNGKVAALLELGAGFDPEKSGLENIFFSASIMGIPREEIEKKIDDIIAFADIGEFINQPVKSYSSGMFARVAFSLNVHIDPDILIIDEALSVGDAFFQHKCIRKIKEMRERGVTLLFVSHSIESVIELCDKAILLERGELIMEGDTKTVAKEYYKRSFHLQNSMTLNSKDTKELLETKEDRDLLLPLIDEAVKNLNAENIFKIHSFETLNINGEVTDSFVEGDYAFVAVTLESLYNIGNISLAIELKDSSGLLLTGESIFNKTGKSLFFEKGKKKRVVFKFKVNLLAGQYAVRFRINRVKNWDRSDNLLLHLNEEAAIIYVTQQPNNFIWFKFRHDFEIEVFDMV